MEASTKVSTIRFNHNATHKGFNQTFAFVDLDKQAELS